MKFYSKQNKGFTLIELLVVISIIGLLSSVVLASLSSARSKARDAQRRIMAKQFQTALELYKSEKGVYPTSGSGGTVTCTTPSGSWSASADPTCWSYLFTNGSPSLSSFIPQFVDPRQTYNTGASYGPLTSGPPPEYGFAYFSVTWGAPGNCTAGQDYVFIYRLENPQPSAPTDVYCNGTAVVTTNPYIAVVKSK